MIRQRVGVEIWCRWLERDYLLVNQVLNFVLEVDTILSIMPNIVGMLSTYLIKFVEFLIYIHEFGPHMVDVSGCSQSLVQLCSSFSSLKASSRI